MFLSRDVCTRIRCWGSLVILIWKSPVITSTSSIKTLARRWKKVFVHIYSYYSEIWYAHWSKIASTNRKHTLLRICFRLSIPLENINNLTFDSVRFVSNKRWFRSRNCDAKLRRCTSFFDRQHLVAPAIPLQSVIQPQEAAIAILNGIGAYIENVSELSELAVGQTKRRKKPAAELSGAPSGSVLNGWSSQCS